jgi:long-chain acyl-CoA synthetase
MKIKRTFEILRNSASQFPEQKALNAKKGGQWDSLSYREYDELSDALAIGLLDIGVQKGDKVASLTNNRPEWNVLDMSLSKIGAVHVPLSPNYSKADLVYILNLAEVQYIFVANQVMYKYFSQLMDQLPQVKRIYIFSKSEGDDYFQDLIQKSPDGKERLLQRQQELNEDDLVSIYFTSGTSGRPKGAMVSHKNIVSVVLSMTEIYQLHPNDKVISFLPLSHSYESAHNYMYQYAGASIYYADNSSSLLQNFEEIKPVMFLSVPMMLERLSAGLLSLSDQKDLLDDYKTFSSSYKPEVVSKKELKILREKYAPLTEKWRMFLGESLRIISAGGAALPERLLGFFSLLDIAVLEVYGMTETYAISVNSLLYGRKTATAGVPEKNVKVKISDEGEILCKSPYVTRGYYNREDLNSDIFDEEGYFKTGDLGSFDGPFLKITGRKKSVFKNASGNFIAPEKIEKELINASQKLSHVLICGKDKKELLALIVGNKDAGTDEIHSEVRAILAAHNKKCMESEMIGGYILLNDEWNVENGSLTPTMKLKRNDLLKKYKDKINEFYAS